MKPGERPEPTTPAPVDDDRAGAIGRLADRGHALARALLSDPEAARDAAQAALLSALASAPRFDPARGRLEAWFFAIVRRRCRDEIAARKSRAGSLDHEPAAAPDEGDRILVRFDRAFAALDPDRRAAFALVSIQGLSVAEAARIEDVPEGTIKSRCARARAELLRSLEESP